ncbi:MAG: phosphoribosylformylglycinamidine cyclo-ligase [Chitinophagaceae bacterium]|nr:MAG: phosphoribosylformylglycinamidine cyclo-ligase [Chitinophagaceae bacterium]
MDSENRYAKRGVSAQKEEVHAAVKGLDQGLFPKAFCKIYPDYLSGDKNYGSIIHADGSGTKSILAYLKWRESGDLSCWEGIAQDAIVMNLDDMLCVGAEGPFIFSSILNRNKHLIKGEVIEAIIQGSYKVFQTLKEFGVHIEFLGGETADVGDLVRTLTVDGTMACRIPLKNVINAADIKAGNCIVGLSSTGQAAYENAPNSGIGSNGLTSARHDLLSDFYLKKYPECADPSTPADLAYSGPYKLEDNLAGGENIGDLILSPTRTYAPVLLETFKHWKGKIDGIIHCTGGGQTKVLHYADNCHIIKDDLFETPVIFKEIQKVSGAAAKEMYQVFNMGHRMEIYTDEKTAFKIIESAAQFNIDAKVIGRVEAAPEKKLSIHSGEEVINF